MPRVGRRFFYISRVPFPQKTAFLNIVLYIGNTMPKNESPRELILLYHIGLRPKDIIALGYPQQTVYKYKKYYVDARDRTLAKLIPALRVKNLRGKGQ